MGTSRSRAVLLPNMVEFPAVSMKRYARELAASLKRIADQEWEFVELTCHRAASVERVLPGRVGEQWASRVGRFVKYPLMARRITGDVFHILDHSHANLATVLPADRTVMTCHDIIPYLAAKGLVPIPTGRLTRYTFPLLRINAMKRCRYIVADSEATKQDLIEHGGLPPDKIQVVYCGVDPVFSPEPMGGGPDRASRTREVRARYGIPESAKVVFHVGTAVRYKNTPTLLRAFRRLRNDTSLGEDVYLMRAGAPFFEEEEALLDELGIRSRVVHVGRIPDDAGLADHYRAADVFAFPSLYEGFGWPPLEAMACGIPSVTSHVASLPEVIGDTGLTVSPKDDAALAEGLYRLLRDDALRDELRRRCVHRARQFTWEACAEGVLSVYRKVVSGPAERP